MGPKEAWAKNPDDIIRIGQEMQAEEDPLDVLHLGSGCCNSSLMPALRLYLRIARRIEIHGDGLPYKSVDGVVYSGDGKKLLFIPACRHEPLHIPEGVKEISPHARGCLRLDELYVPESLMAGVRFAAAFGPGCKFGTVEIGKGTKEIPALTFNGVKIREAILPDGMKKIGHSAFSGCSLETINLPDSIEEIGSGAFLGCNVEEVRIPKRIGRIGVDALGYRIHKIWMPRPIGGVFTSLMNLSVSEDVENGWPIEVHVRDKAFAMPSVLKKQTMGSYTKLYGEFLRGWRNGTPDYGFAKGLFHDAPTGQLRQDTALLELGLNPDDTRAQRFVQHQATLMLRRYVGAQDSEKALALMLTGLVKAKALEEAATLAEPPEIRAYAMEALDKAGRQKQHIIL